MRKIRTLLAKMLKASEHRNVIWQLFDIVVLKLRVNLGPRDYYFFEFFKRHLSWRQKSRYASVRGSRYWVFQNNQFKYQVLFTDKYIQKAIFQGLNLPTPRLIALVGAGGGISSLNAFRETVEGAPNEFVVKPVSSRGGDGIRKVTKISGHPHEGGHPVKIEDLWQEVQPYLQRGVLLEETVHNCDALQNMNPSSLNTFRVITFRCAQNNWVPICSYLKVGRENSAVDNLIAGGMIVRVDDEGRTGATVAFDGSPDRSVHPDSDALLSGIVIDGYRRVVDLAVEASGHFSQMGILGWDIALTNSGPTLIEVNATPSIDYPQVAYGGLVTDEMTEVLKTRHIFSRYPRTHMYPGFIRGGSGRV